MDDPLPAREAHGHRRRRPALHFTAREGWTNDPHGIVRVAGTWHLFFQYNPAGVQWSPGCHWGHAVGRDLVAWRQVDVALTPVAGEVGCWSGSTVVDDEGPAILYTSVLSDDWGRGSVTLARPTRGMAAWRRRPAEPVIPGPPSPQIVQFRDPQVRREDGRWKAVLGAGLAGIGGCAVQYSSPDLEHWMFDGVLAHGRATDRDPLWTGTVWECPQLLRVDGAWVLLVSVWADHVCHHVVHAVGDLDGHTFTPRAWGRFTHGEQLYATTTFTDGAGRPCAMSWLRERGNRAPEGSPWCSAMSLPHLLRLDGDRLVASFHPDLDAHLPTERVDDAASPLALRAGEGPWRLRLDIAPHGAGPHGAGPHGQVQVAVSGPHGALWRLAASTDDEHLVVTDLGGEVLLELPFPPARDRAGELDIVVDTDVLEVTWSAGWGVGAARVPDILGADVRLDGALLAGVAAGGLVRPRRPLVG